MRNASRRLHRSAAGCADTAHMAVVRSAAAAKHVDVRETAAEVSILPAELKRIADVELKRKLGVTHAG